MSDGGWYYQTAELYAQQMLINWISWLPTAWLFARALRHCTGKRMSWAYGLLILTLLTSATLNRMHNP
ncbi:hypothetical protein CLV45_0419 [Hymenobacter chitinivorans DSM 11115]|uniref:Uncharacterized protein n=2 Tax=Hymenobacter chitinivorans TaxID=89969 RepID=A0A2M9BM20_9BACT|nr:hypothetical protein CLV45_0419 [Hymenobacter chitinivorans DSM 11115]